MPISIERINKLVCEYYCQDEFDYKVTLEKFHSKTRKREVVQARFFAMLFSKAFTKHTLEVIGKKIGDKDHASVLHGIKTIRNLVSSDKQVKKDHRELIKMIWPYVNDPVITEKDRKEAERFMFNKLTLRLIQKINKFETHLNPEDLKILIE